MPTFFSPQEYAKSLGNRAARLRKLASPRKAALHGSKLAVRLAPRKTGETARGIRSRPLKGNGWMIQSVVSRKGASDFMQNFWANQTLPHRSPRMRWNNRTPTLYGVGHRITGVPGFFRKTAAALRLLFPKLTIQEVNTVMRRK